MSPPPPALATPMLQVRKTKTVFANFPRGFWRFPTKFQLFKKQCSPRAEDRAIFEDLRLRDQGQRLDLRGQRQRLPNVSSRPRTSSRTPPLQDRRVASGGNAPPIFFLPPTEFFWEEEVAVIGRKKTLKFAISARKSLRISAKTFFYFIFWRSPAFDRKICAFGQKKPSVFGEDLFF